MDILGQIKNWSEAFLPENLFLVAVEQKAGSKKIGVYIDGDEGVNIESCRLLSRHLSEKLDELDYGSDAYYLEVSSPGTDRPLLTKRQYAKHKGRELEVTLKAGTVISGKLSEVTENDFTILLKDKKKGYTDAPGKTINFDDVAQSVVLISFK